MKSLNAIIKHRRRANRSFRKPHHVQMILGSHRRTRFVVKMSEYDHWRYRRVMFERCGLRFTMISPYKETQVFGWRLS